MIACSSEAARRMAAQELFERREGIWKDYDPERVRAAFEATRGLLDGVDVEALVREIRAARYAERWDLPSH